MSGIKELYRKNQRQEAHLILVMKLLWLDSYKPSLSQRGTPLDETTLIDLQKDYTLIEFKAWLNQHEQGTQDQMNQIARFKDYFADLFGDFDTYTVKDWVAHDARSSQIASALSGEDTEPNTPLLTTTAATRESSTSLSSIPRTPSPTFRHHDPKSAETLDYCWGPHGFIRIPDDTPAELTDNHSDDALLNYKQTALLLRLRQQHIALALMAVADEYIEEFKERKDSNRRTLWAAYTVLHLARLIHNSPGGVRSHEYLIWLYQYVNSSLDAQCRLPSSTLKKRLNRVFDEVSLLYSTATGPVKLKDVMRLKKRDIIKRDKKRKHDHTSSSLSRAHFHTDGHYAGYLVDESSISLSYRERYFAGHVTHGPFKGREIWRNKIHNIEKSLDSLHPLQLYLTICGNITDPYNAKYGLPIADDELSDFDTSSDDEPSEKNHSATGDSTLANAMFSLKKHINRVIMRHNHGYQPLTFYLFEQTLDLLNELIIAYEQFADGAQRQAVVKLLAQYLSNGHFIAKRDPELNQEIKQRYRNMISAMESYKIPAISATTDVVTVVHEPSVRSVITGPESTPIQLTEKTFTYRFYQLKRELSQFEQNPTDYARSLHKTILGFIKEPVLWELYHHDLRAFLGELTTQDGDTATLASFMLAEYRYFEYTYVKQKSELGQQLEEFEANDQTQYIADAIKYYKQASAGGCLDATIRLAQIHACDEHKAAATTEATDHSEELATIADSLDTFIQRASEQLSDVARKETTALSIYSATIHRANIDKIAAVAGKLIDPMQQYQNLLIRCALGHTDAYTELQQLLASDHFVVIHDKVHKVEDASRHRVNTDQKTQLIQRWQCWAERCPPEATATIRQQEAQKLGLPLPSIKEEDALDYLFDAYLPASVQIDTAAAAETSTQHRQALISAFCQGHLHAGIALISEYTDVSVDEYLLVLSAALEAETATPDSMQKTELNTIAGKLDLTTSYQFPENIRWRSMTGSSRGQIKTTLERLAKAGHALSEHTLEAIGILSHDGNLTAARLLRELIIQDCCVIDESERLVAKIQPKHRKGKGKAGSKAPQATSSVTMTATLYDKTLAELNRLDTCLGLEPSSKLSSSKPVTPSTGAGLDDEIPDTGDREAPEDESVEYTQTLREKHATLVDSSPLTQYQSITTTYKAVSCDDIDARIAAWQNSFSEGNINAATELARYYQCTNQHEQALKWYFVANHALSLVGKPSHTELQKLLADYDIALNLNTDVRLQLFDITTDNALLDIRKTIDTIISQQSNSLNITDLLTPAFTHGDLSAGARIANSLPSDVEKACWHLLLQQLEQARDNPQLADRDTLFNLATSLYINLGETKEDICLTWFSNTDALKGTTPSAIERAISATTLSGGTALHDLDLYQKLNAAARAGNTQATLYMADLIKHASGTMSPSRIDTKNEDRKCRRVYDHDIELHRGTHTPAAEDAPLPIDWRIQHYRFLALATMAAKSTSRHKHHFSVSPRMLGDTLGRDLELTALDEAASAMSASTDTYVPHGSKPKLAEPTKTSIRFWLPSTTESVEKFLESEVDPRAKDLDNALNVAPHSPTAGSE